MVMPRTQRGSRFPITVLCPLNETMWSPSQPIARRLHPGKRQVGCCAVTQRHCAVDGNRRSGWSSMPHAGITRPVESTRILSMRVVGSARISRPCAGRDRTVTGKLSRQITRPVGGVLPAPTAAPASRGPASPPRGGPAPGRAERRRAAGPWCARPRPSWRSSVTRAYIASASAAVWVDQIPAIPSGNGLQCTSRSALASAWRCSSLRVSRRAIVRRNAARNRVTVSSGARSSTRLLDLAIIAGSN